MNRPRNRQPRAPNTSQDNQSGTNSPRQRGGSSHRGGRAPATPQQAGRTVPGAAKVILGASVFIVLKEDQPAGQETSGIVEDVLTRGDHPRGIKVRLRGGLVGRVQRMGTGGQPASAGGPERYTMKYSDAREEYGGFAEGPPPRSLADFMPGFGDAPKAKVDEEQITARCPICDGFEGDEVAVSRHVETEHLKE